MDIYLYFFLSFLGDSLAYIYYQKYLDGHRRDVLLLLWAVVWAFLVWFFIFKLQEKGLHLRILIPLWASGTAVFGYFIAGIATNTPIETLFNPVALFLITVIGLGVFFLSRMTFSG